MAVLDHLVYAAPDLTVAVEQVAERVGIRPVEGGPHVGLGTRNFLLGLGGRSYLEIVGPDPDQPEPAGPRLFGVDDLAAPALVGWAVATDDIDMAVARAREAGVDLDDAYGMSRRRPDGTLLSWRLTPPLPGVRPFLIDWGDTAHPADALPVVPLRSFEITHPHPDALRAELAALGVTPEVQKGERAGLTGRLDGLTLEPPAHFGPQNM
ncbi:VOC family protein [Actinoallomurus vinaceus]|uniref:VOC family protein n=1 Tax=Actinoallomurus vinaceus TaxID=1080074 RepID=A0ABP8UEY3_9ACTN